MRITASTIEPFEQGFRLNGDLTFSTVSDLVESGKALIHNGTKSATENEINIEMSSVKKLDSAGIALLLEWKRECQLENKTCHFKHLSQQAISLIKTYKLQSVLYV